MPVSTDRDILLVEDDPDIADLPEHHARVAADIGLVERALSNLIDNAIHYTPSGGAIRVRVENEEQAVCVAVQDSGSGIPEDELPHIFERFYRVDKSRDREKGGAGLGLAIAKTILELHDRALEVESTVGEGTTFRFRLPTEAAGRPLKSGDGEPAVHDLRRTD